MRRTIFLSTLLLCGAAAIGQLTPFEFGAGYGRSASFAKNSGGSGALVGPEFSVSQALLALPLSGEVRIGASALFGGSLSSGSDADGSVYRLFARWKSPSAGPESLYGVVGVYWGTAQSKGNSFDNVHGTGLDLGVGMPAGQILPGLPKTSFELIFHQGSEPQLRGWSVGVVVRL
jgi:hypothetical protein